MTTLYWFRNNLRLSDNPSFTAACEASEKMACIYVLPYDFNDVHPHFNYPFYGAYRKKFLIESLINLDKNLREKGLKLFVFPGDIKNIVPELLEQHPEISQIFASKEPCFNEQEEEKSLCHFRPMHLGDDNFLIPINDLPFDLDRLPSIFTGFRKKIEKAFALRIESKPKVYPKSLELLRKNDLVDLQVLLPKIAFHPNSVIALSGGENEAQDYLEHYFSHPQLAQTYKQSRNGLIGQTYSTKFSVYLALGCLSPSQIVRRLHQYEKEVCKNESTYWIFFELLWREFFRYAALKEGRRFFMLKGLQEIPPQVEENQRRFIKWMDGETHEPFVNANMRELQETGFMSNRGRQNAASYLVHQLNIPWLWGAAYFEAMLVDYDPASNYGNWLYQSGQGHDPRSRIFNIARQASMYDPDGEYQDLWLV